jgi:hypothetical protein
MDEKLVSKLIEIGKQQSNADRKDPFSAGPVFIGMTLFIDIRLSGTAKVKANCQLVGFVQGKHLIVTTPQVDGSYINFSRANDIVVRYIIGGSVYGFRTQALHSINKPLYMTFLEYPKVIEHVSLRGAPRVQAVIPYELEGASDSKNQILNISATGALMQVSEAPVLGQIMVISFTLPNGSLVYKIPCSVKRVDITSSRTLIGISFDDTHGDFKLIGDYLSVVFKAIQELANQQT